jgi:hypothetical protein
MASDVAGAIGVYKEAVTYVVFALYVEYTLF